MKSRRVTTRFINDFMIIDLPFNSLDGETSKTLKNKLAELLIGTGIENIIIDLTNINFIDAQGVETLQYALNLTIEKKGITKLISPTQYIINTLIATNLYTKFEIVNSVEEALENNLLTNNLHKSLINLTNKLNNILPA